MPVGGRPQKENRVGRSPRTHEFTEVLNVPYEEGPPLPPLRGRAVWPAWTRDWWAALSSMPHCRLWGPADWRYAFDTAMVARKFALGDLTVAAELRIREKAMGTTHDARLGLKIRYIDPPEEQVVASGGNVSRLDDYRDL